MILVFILFVVTHVLTVSSDKLESLTSSYSAPAEQNDGYYDRMPAGISYMEEEEDPLALLAASIPGGGVPGEDYPILSSVPDTDFDCGDKGLPGYFADAAEEARCQVFHICQFDGRHDSFLCPNGTIFNQRYFVCDWWFNVDCATTEMYTDLNAKIGKTDKDTTTSSNYKAPSQEYGPPKPLDGKYKAPETPSPQYSAPTKPTRQYGILIAPAQQYGAPQTKDKQYGFQQSPSQLYAAPSQRYSPPKRPNKTPSQFYELPGY